MNMFKAEKWIKWRKFGESGHPVRRQDWYLLNIDNGSRAAFEKSEFFS
jgi:hypothetical protein